MSRIRVLRDAAAVAKEAAEFIALYVKSKPDARVLVATGNTPVPTYEALAQLNPDISDTWAVQLDEYLIPDDDPRLLYAWMARAYLTPLGVTQVLRFDLSSQDTQRMCRLHADKISALGGIDLAILGLGPNGHLGFNEPPSGADAPTRAVTLSQASLASNAAYWSAAPHGSRAAPRNAVTVGMDIILKADTILLLVTGQHKRDILARTLSETPNPELPSSYLRDTNLVVITDQDVTGGAA